MVHHAMNRVFDTFDIDRATRVPRFLKGDRSQQRFQLLPEHHDAVIRACTFHKEVEIPKYSLLNLNANVINVGGVSKPNKDQITVGKTSISSTYPRPRMVASPLGILGELPRELSCMILLETDIATIFSLQKTNSSAWGLLNNLHEYRVVMEHAYAAFCALLRTGKANEVTLNEFYDLLCMPRCSYCGNRYGNRVFLTEWKRYCDDCYVHRLPRYLAFQVVTTATATRILFPQPLEAGRGIQAVSRNLFITDSGFYYHDCNSCGSLHYMPEWNIHMQYPCSEHAISVEKAIRVYHNVAKKMPSEAMVQKLIIASTRYSLCCYLPSYDNRKGLDQGVSCAGCRLRPRTIRAHLWMQDRTYAREEFIEHFVWCEPAQELWMRSISESIKPFYFARHRGSGAVYIGVNGTWRTRRLQAQKKVLSLSRNALSYLSDSIHRLQ